MTTSLEGFLVHLSVGAYPSVNAKDINNKGELYFKVLLWHDARCNFVVVHINYIHTEKLPRTIAFSKNDVHRK